MRDTPPLPRGVRGWPRPHPGSSGTAHRLRKPPRREADLFSSSFKARARPYPNALLAAGVLPDEQGGVLFVEEARQVQSLLPEQ